MNRAEKANVIEQLREKANNASIALVSDFRGLKVEELEDLRGRLRQNELQLQVVKNTLARLALEDSPHQVIKDQLRECCAITFGYTDPVIPAKALVDYSKQNKKFALKFASYNGQYLDEQQIKQLSELPSKDELLAKLLGTFNAVPTNFVSLFANMLRNFLYALNGIKEQKENNSQSQ